MINIEPKYLVFVSSDNNHNKMYRMIPQGNSFTVEWGRIGVGGIQTASYSINQWDKKYNEKIRKGYVDQSRLVAETITKEKKNKEYLDISNQVIASIVSRLQSMARQAIADNYTISSNNVTQVMIDEAQLILNNLISADNLELFNKVLVELFKIIPRKMKKVKDNLAKKVEDFGDIIQKEQDLLDVMRGQVVQQSVESSQDEEESEVKNNHTILDAMGLRFEEITKEEKEMIKKELGEIKDKFYSAWKIVNIKTQEKYDKFVKENDIKDTRLLWHGSRTENWWSIINNGLKIRPTNAVLTGSMFGNGCYFSNSADKSKGYTSLSGSYWSKGSSNSAFMALNLIAYGKPYDVYSFDNKFYNLNFDSLQKMCLGAHVLHAHGGTGMLKRDEIVIYNENQATIKYLVEIR